MYTRDETRQIRQAFWTAFGQYMALHPSAEGEKVGWINYKTGIKHLYFKMDAGSHHASIAIEMAHPDAGIRALMYEQFLPFRTLLHGMLGEEWDWSSEHQDAFGKTSARIGTELGGVSVFNRSDWPALISFFKPRMLVLDAFWTDAQYSFELFR
ncbi:DUF4268 domain-containing protein [Pedobacter yulinensis]|uniref:DUF4268 domain-containing protein n=1 Tax=Pedobacter yulinensis TaxID=2126353 RepID=A0A2T3HL94_9SPHI|nr:DUF4268 domain-containing protein [Pedobacter yulinensis]PST83212.1 DUF4268 domain-containing protein [Pedobacter yulinensis]